MDLNNAPTKALDRTRNGKPRLGAGRRTLQQDGLVDCKNAMQDRQKLGDCELALGEPGYSLTAEEAMMMVVRSEEEGRWRKKTMVS
ncbi:hypothetical protein TWF281_007337 [Arthrobotrys megalospora]